MLIWQLFVINCSVYQYYSHVMSDLPCFRCRRTSSSTTATVECSGILIIHLLINTLKVKAEGCISFMLRDFYRRVSLWTIPMWTNSVHSYIDPQYILSKVSITLAVDKPRPGISVRLPFIYSHPLLTIKEYQCEPVNL